MDNRKNSVKFMIFIASAFTFLIIVAVMCLAISSHAAEIKYIDITEGPETADIYIPDCDDDCPYSDDVPLPDAVQYYLWEKCKNVIPEQAVEMYVFMIGLIDAESEFTATAIHHNGNGSTDKGLCQTNSCHWKDLKRHGYIETSDDLNDMCTSIDCCFWELLHKLYDYGICERLYYYYNTGSTKGSSNKNSRRMVGLWNKWKEEFNV